MPTRSPSLLQSELDTPIRICGVPESALAVAAALTSKWPFSKLTWTVTDPLPGLTDDEWQEAFRLALSYISAVCQIDFEYTANARTANILAAAGRIDGPSGTLAWSELPNGGGSRQLQQKYDTGELKWVVSETPRNGELDIVRVVCHECHHVVGVSHIGSGNLLAPTYSNSIRRPQAGDIAELVKRYGRRTTPAPTPVPVPQPTPTPTPQPSGGFMGNLAALLKLLAQLQPIITWLINNQASFGTIMDVLKKLAEAFGNKPAPVQALNLGISRDQLKSILGHVSGAFSVLAAQTPTPVDDAVASVFAQAIQTDWLLDLLHMLVSGGTVTEAELAAAYAEVITA